MTERIDGVAGDLVALVQAARARPEAERTAALREVLRTVDEALMLDAVETDDPPLPHLRRLAGSLRTHLPEPVEDAIAVRARTLIRLLRQNAFEPAWTLAADNASGVFEPATTISTWTGARRSRHRLPLPTLVEDGTVFARLPGFRDPRWAVPDHVYDISGDVAVRSVLEGAVFRDGRLELAGAAWLRPFDASRDEVVTVVAVAGPDRMPCVAARQRSPQRVTSAGPGVAALAWAGWSATIDLALLVRRPEWRLRIEVDHNGVRRDQPLGLSRGPLAEQVLIEQPYEGSAVRAALGQGPRGGLVLRVQPATARRSGPAGRAVLRRLRRAMVAAPRRT